MAPTDRPATLRIALADDAVLLLEALAAALGAAGFTVVGQAADVAELLSIVAARPEVVVVDVRMPPTHEAARHIRAEYPGTAILMLSQRPWQPDPNSAIA